MMRCESVRQWLEACRRETDDLETSGMDDVARHLEQCPDCRAAQRSIEAADALIGAKMRDVPVPNGLKERLLERLAEARVPLDGKVSAPLSVETKRREAPSHLTPPTAAQRTPTRRWPWRSKRFRVTAVTGSAAALVLLAAWYGLWRTSETWTIDRLQQRISDRAFDGTGAPADPDAPKPPLRQRALLAGRTKTIDGRTVHVFHYRVFVSGRQFDAEVYVVAVSAVDDPVPFYASRLVSTARGNTMVTWSDRTRVYVFITQALEGEQLLEHLLVPAQLT